jgi:SpoVK/Ycf46/Vps4 family AAA+-type ATPase
MLTQMEAFEGIFIASTNRMDGLDPAALRRFDLKVKVDYLTYEQRVGLFSDTCLQMGFTPNESINDDLISLTNLTPGDFAAVSRQSKFRPIKSAQDLYERLSEECALKGGVKGKNMGFL